MRLKSQDLPSVPAPFPSFPANRHFGPSLPTEEIFFIACQSTGLFILKIVRRPDVAQKPWPGGPAAEYVPAVPSIAAR